MTSMNAVLFWLILLLLFYFMYVMGLRRAGAAAGAPSPPPAWSPEMLAHFQAKLSPALAISGQKTQGPLAEFDGRPRGSSEAALAQIREALAEENVTPLLLEGEQNEVRVLLLPEKGFPRAGGRPKWWLHTLLFVLTGLTTTWAGALHAGVNLLQEPSRWAVGLPYSLGLLLILGAHELGHYFTARHHGIDVTPPYFIPVPFALGTFGAFIRIKSLTPNRRALFDVAVAGPLAGLVFAVPALLVGLRYSSLVAGGGAGPEVAGGGVSVSSSVLLALLSKLSLGASAAEHRLVLHPLAFAGWLGLMVTALNLLPIGQLDGGHMAHGLLGARKAHAVSVVALAALFGLALFIWPGLMFWAVVVFFIAGTRDTPASDDVTPVGRARQAVGYFTFLLLLLILLPVPHTLYQKMGIHCPYL